MKSQFRTLQDFYTGMENLIAGLQAAEHAQEAARLRDILSGQAWTTSSELLGELQLALTELRGSYPGDLARLIRECRTFARHHRRILRLS